MAKRSRSRVPDLAVTASGLQDGGTYYIRVRAADDSAGFATGEYKLIVGSSYATGGFGYASWI